MAEKLLKTRDFQPSQNDYDWLGAGIYFWEANPLRGLEFAREVSRRKATLRKATVIGAVVDLGYCLDLTTSRGLRQTKLAYEQLRAVFEQTGQPLPVNHADGIRHNLDCAVLNYLHFLQKEEGRPPFDSVKGIFVEAPELYAGSAFHAKNHIQIAIRNPDCIKGVFRVAKSELDADL